MSVGISAKLIVLITAAFLLFAGGGRWLLTHACHGSTKLGKVMQRVAAYFGGVAQAVQSAFASVFGGVKGLLSAVFSWETLFWFLAAGGLLTWAVAQNHPGQIPGWIDEMDLERTVTSPVVLITLVPILFVLIAVGRMQGVRWHSRQMGIIGILLAMGGLILLTWWARTEMKSPVAIAVAGVESEVVDEKHLVPIESTVQVLNPVDRTGEASNEDDESAAPDVTTVDSDSDAAAESPEEAPASIQVLDPIETPAVSDSDQDVATEELETVKIEVVDTSGQSREVDHLPAWVESARNSDNLRTIAADTQRGLSILADWMDTKPVEAAVYAPTGTMLYGDVATLNETQFEGEYVATVEHVGTIDEGTEFARYAAERLAYDRLYQYYPDMRNWGWSPRTSTLHQNFVIEQCIETSLLHVGDFEEPVYTVHARIVVHESQDLAAYNQLRNFEQRERLVMAGVGVGGLAWLFTVMSAYLRINLSTGGRHRNWLRLGGVACALLPLFVVIAQLRGI